MTSLFSRLQKLNKDGTKTPWESAYVKDRPELAVRVVVRKAEPLLTAKTENAALIVECRNSLPAVLNLIEAADREANWDEPRIVPTKECPDRIEAIRLLRKAVAVFVSGQEEPK